jgi:DNA mismatch repair ATPase MutS
MRNDYRTFPTSLILQALKTNYNLQKCIAMFLQLNKDPVLARQALQDSLNILDDTVRLLEGLMDGLGKSELGSRLPKGFSKHPTIEEFVDTMQITLDLLSIETEILLNKTLEISEEEYAHRSERTKDLIRLMGYFARYVKSVVLAMDPNGWTEDLENRFGKFVKIQP